MAVHINLLREEQQIQTERKRDPLKLGLLGVLLIALVMLGYYLVQAAKLSGITRQVHQLEATWNAKKPDFEKAQARQAELSSLIAKADALRGIMNARFLWAAFLADLTNTIPSNASLTSLSGTLKKDKSRLSCSLSGVIAGENPRQLAEDLRGTIRRMLEERFDEVEVVFETLEDDATPYVIRGKDASGAKFSLGMKAQLRGTGKQAEADAS